MSQEPTDDLEDRVVEILELPEGEQHAAFTALRAEFPAHEELLLRWENAARAIAPGVLPTEDVASTVPPAPPERIGDYEVKSVLGSGGMGTVYLAEQQQPVQRQVAIKLIHVALDGARVMDRFDLERRALARMNHDAIAKVFDAGTTESGQPYFVMEHVPGVPLLEYCDSHELRVRDRIQLFRQICAGVQHAHQRGVIHRDLKPGNILVMTDGDRATPKIIDFGLARATDRTLVQEAAFTMQGQVLGTPEYMSPEQATNDTQQIDTRTDIYSLGVILYELLSGGLPFPSAQLRRSGWRGIQHMLRGVEPPKPSTRISGDHRAAQLRRTTAIRLARRLHGDLDWIVSKAMSKDPARRYESAIAFADDLGRHLRHEPVVAGPPSPGYRLAKFVRRNRIPVVGAAAVLVVLITGWVLSWNFYLQETEEAREKARQRQVAEAATAATKKQEALARSHLERFRKLANVVKLVVAIKMARELYPAWPEMIPRLEAWIRDSAEPLAGELDGVRQALMELESRALARSAEELQREREQHPAWPEYLLWKSRVTSFQRAMDIREGKIKPKPVAVPDDAPKDAGALLRLACSKYGYIAEKPGEEALGLALARRAYERSDPKMHYVYLEGLAWALFYNGQDREALAAADQAVRAAPPALKRYIGSRRQSVRQNVRQSKPKLQAAIQAVAKLEARFERERAFCFESLADSYLHTALRRMEKSLVEFVAEEGVKADVGHRLAWARRIEELTLRHPRATATWEEARLAIRNADGVTASGLYAKHPIDLKPQTGLVPIGMNPVTRLWEFYHLRSAFDPGSGGDPARLEIPKHGDDGRIRVGDDTGMVFVLIPGGTFAMGSQAENPQGRNYFRRARANESPVHDVTLEPFFLSRYELTQGQWLRLVGGGNPSFLKPGMTLTTGEKITLAHPVDRITWDVCRRILDQNGLDFPTEAQWEYGCRAGSNTNWFRGNNIRSMRGYGNLWDRTGKRLNSASPVPPVPWEDGYSVTCPVGTFDANAFGLHDVHGNDNEWCRDYFASYTRPVAPGDGERQSGGGGVRVARGGGCSDHAYLARSSYRMPTPAANRRSDITLRPARAIRKSP